MGQRDDACRLKNEIEFDDAFFGGPTVGKKRGRGTEKAKVFVALSLGEKGNPKFLKMKKAKDARKKAVQTFAENFFAKDAVIYTDGLQSFVSALGHFDHRPRLYDPNSGTLRWLHIVISNAKAFILGTFHGLPSKYLDSYLNEFFFRFSRRSFGTKLFDHLCVALAVSSAELKG